MHHNPRYIVTQDCTYTIISCMSVCTLFVLLLKRYTIYDTRKVFAYK